MATPTPVRFRKRPIEIEAIQWDGTADGAVPIIDWILSGEATASFVCSDPDRCVAYDGDTQHTIVIRTLEGDMAASLGDYVIKGIRGEFYPCKADIFEATYERVEP